MIMKKRKIQKNIKAISKVVIDKYGKNGKYLLSNIKTYNR